MSAIPRGALLVGCALVASLALIGAYLAAGGSSYTPTQVQDPCEDRPWRDPDGLQEAAEQFSLSALDGAACQLGVSREELALALASPESREAFTRRYGIGDRALARAVRAGLLRAVDDAEEAGVLNPFVAGPVRATLRSMPLDQAIELLRDGGSLLDSIESYFGPAQDLIEQFLP